MLKRIFKCTLIVCIVFALAVFLSSCFEIIIPGVNDGTGVSVPNNSGSGGNSSETNEDGHKNTSDENKTEGEEETDGNKDNQNGDNENSDNAEGGDDNGGDNGDDNGGAHTHTYTSLVTAPTCTEPGYTTYTCEGCADSYIDDYVEPGDHNYQLDKYLESADKNPCEYGLTAVYICKDCKTVKTEQTSPSMHNVAEWQTKNEPLQNSGGEIFGVCTACKKSLSVSLPSLNSGIYVYTEVLEEKNCIARRGVGTYTVYVKGDGSYTGVSSEGASAVSFTTELGALPYHSLNGNFATESEYDVSTPGIKEFSSYKATCTKAGNGYFNCELCANLVFVTTTKEHTGTSTVKKAPTCDETGTREIFCTVCKTSYTEELRPLGHSYKVESGIYEGEMMTLSLSCSTCKVTKSESASVYRKDIIERSTCHTKGSAECFVIIEGVSYSCVVELPTSYHCLNGEEMDPTKEYTPGNGINEFTGQEATETTPGKGYYICDDCKSPQFVTTVKESEN